VLSLGEVLNLPEIKRMKRYKYWNNNLQNTGNFVSGCFLIDWLMKNKKNAMFNFDKLASELYKAKKENSIEPTGSGDAL